MKEIDQADHLIESLRSAARRLDDGQSSGVHGYLRNAANWIERLKPRAMEPDEIVAAFNAGGVRDCDDWALIQGHADDEPVLSSASTLWWYPLREALYIAQGMERDVKGGG
jgi:hypothetical protein